MLLYFPLSEQKTEKIQHLVALAFFTPLTIHVDCVKLVTDFCFLGFYIKEGLTHGLNLRKLLKMAQQRLYFLRMLGKKYDLAHSLLASFYCCSAESILIYSFCVWYGNSTTAQKKDLHKPKN